MIKFALRKNLKYPLQLLIWKEARSILKIIIADLYDFKLSLIFTFLMFVGEFLMGLIVYIYQKTFLSKKVSSTDNKLAQLFLKIQKPHMRQDDSKSKIYFLMVIAAYLDFIEFIMSVTYLPEYENTSTSLEMRLSGAC